MTSITAVSQLRRLLWGALLSAGSFSVLAAQGQGGPGGPGTTRPLPLEAKRKAEFTATRGTWISLDVSPDGRTIVFDLLGDLYTMPITGGKATALTTGMAYDAQPRFSPDGKRVVFVSDRSGGDNVWIMSLDRSDTTQLTQGNSNQYLSPDWTPDGEYIVVSRGTGAFPIAKLHLYHVDGGTGIPLVREPNQLKTVGAAVSPDGRRVWFAGRTGDWNYNAIFPQYQIGYYDRETGTLSQMSNRYGSAFRPAVSPDGKWLTYGTRQGAETGLRIRNLESGEEDWLAYPIQRDDIESRTTLDALPGYDFTPDSKAVIISYGGEIWRIPLDRSAATRIPFSADVKLDLGPEVKFAYRVDTAATFTVHQIRNPAVSPDGKRVAFVAVDRLYLADLPNGKPRRVTTADVGEFEPAWSPDGKSLTWVTWGDAAGGQIMRIEVDARGARPVQLTRVAALYTDVAWNPDGTRIVAVRQAARDLQAASGNGGGVLGGDFVWIPSAGGDAAVIAPTANRAAPHFVTDQPDRIFAYSPQEGLVSFRWDGTDVKHHLKVTGPMPAGGGGLHPEDDRLVYLPRRVAPMRIDELRGAAGATGAAGGLEQGGAPLPAGLVLMAPRGDHALAQVNNDVYSVVVPRSGGPVPSVSVTGGGSVPTVKLSDVGGEFASWGADGRHLYFALGNTLFTADLDRARAVADSLKTDARIKADSARKAQAAADSLKTLRARSDSLVKAGAAVPDSIKRPLDDLVQRARADSIQKADLATKAKADTTKKKAEKPGYRAEETRLLVEVPRDRPTGSLVLRGGRAITMKGKEIIENADVVVVGDRIAAVGPRGRVRIPRGAKTVDVTGKTLMPGIVDVHFHSQGLIPEIHPSQAWQYLTTLAYGVTTTRDPQTGTTDVLSYEDRVESGSMVGPRIYSTGPGLGSIDNIQDLDQAKRILKRYAQFWDTKTLKMYMSGNRQQRQLIIMAARELGLMPTTEGGIDFRLDLTHTMDGYPGVEHALPVIPVANDVVELFKATQTTNTPTLIVSYGGPFGENYWYTNTEVVDDPKLNRFMPKGQIDTRARRRGAGFGYQAGGWFYRDEYVFARHAEYIKRLIEAGGRAALGGHGQLHGLGNHWELWMLGSGGMSNHDVLRVATIYGAEAIGMGQDLGSLEAGKMADILVLDRNPLENLRNSLAIAYVMKNGRLYEGTTLNEVQPRRKALARQWWAEGMPATAAGIH